jgi:subtilisin family serine protease
MIIGLIDGPVNISHPCFENSRIRTLKESQFAVCKNNRSTACTHGTFVAGILCSKRGAEAPSICPGCELVIHPIFTEGDVSVSNTPLPSPFSSSSSISAITVEDLAQAIIDVVDIGAKVINLSMASSDSVLTKQLSHAYNYAYRKSVILVMASGNQLHGAYNSLINHPWIIPVAACDDNGMPSAFSNFGLLVGRQGLMAPGINIMSASPDGSFTKGSGTSFAAPFVTGTIALLWSIFPEAKAEEVVYSILASSLHIRNSIIPPLLNAGQALNILKAILRK